MMNPGQATETVHRVATDGQAMPAIQALAVLVLEMRDEIACLRGRICDLERQQPETENYDDERNADHDFAPAEPQEV